MIKGCKHTKETKKKLSLARIGKHYPKSSQAKLGHKVSEETRKKISLTLKKIGMKPPDLTGRKLSVEHIKKISGKNSGRWKGGISSVTDSLRRCIFLSWF